MSALDVKCPTCWARPMQFCDDEQGNWRKTPHKTRVTAAQSESAPAPE